MEKCDFPGKNYWNFVINLIFCEYGSYIKAQNR